jgi:hypothetical protein
MILFPLMTTWMCFQLLTASPLPASAWFLAETRDADISQLPAHSKEAEE